MYRVSYLEKLKKALTKLPSIGEKSAERITFFLLSNREIASEIVEALTDTVEHVKFCKRCHGFSEEDICEICKDTMREKVLCVVEKPEDVILLENVIGRRWYYHITGGVLSPINNRTPENLHINDIPDRVTKEGFKEVVLALPPTVEGDTTGYYIKNLLEEHKTEVKISRISRGIPRGSDLSFQDGQTLREALEERKELT